MTLLSIITSIFTLGANASWVSGPFMGIILLLDGWVFELVAKAFNLFLLMCSVNYNTITNYMSGLMDTLQAVVLVFVVFKLGVALISYLLNPEKAQQEGSKIIINIFLTALFLILYNFVFGALNDINMMIMGHYDANYQYTTLSTIASITDTDEDRKGLIMRLVFGRDSEVEDVGDYLAYQTLTIFIYNYGNEGQSGKVADEICTNPDGTCNFAKLINLSSRIGKDIEYHPGAIIMGGFLIFSFVKAAFQVGVRMFKLVILQLLAPVAIMTIVQDGIKSSTFQRYVKKYISVYLEAFIRMFSILIVTVFACKIMINTEEFFGSLPQTSGWVGFLIKVVLLGAGYQFAGELPKLIDDILDTHISGGSDNKGMKFIGNLLGGAVGGALGFASGLSAGAAAGAGGLGAFGNGVAGLFGGAAGGFKGNSIAEKFKSVGSTSQSNRERAQRIARQGGGLPYVGQGIENFFGVPQRQAMETQALVDQATARDNMIKARQDAIVEERAYIGEKDAAGNWVNSDTALDRNGNTVTGSGWYDQTTNDWYHFEGADHKGLKLNSDFVSNAVANDAELNRLYMAYEKDHKTDDYQAYLERKDTVTKAAERYYHEQLFDNKEAQGSATVRETTRLYDQKAAAGEKSTDLAHYRDSDGNRDVKGGIKQARLANESRQSASQNRGASRRANRQGRYGS